MKKIFLGITVLLVLLIGVGVLTFMGKIPALSGLIFKQVELDVQETPDSIYSYYDDIGYINNLKGDTPKSGELVFEGGIDIEHTFTQSEINSWIAAWESEWSDLPFSNSQIRINSDGTVEASSSISVATAESFAKMLGYTDEDIAKAKSYLKYIPDPLPLYAKGTASIVGNVVSIDIQDFKVAGFTLPSSISSAMGDVLEDVTQRTRTLSNDTSVEEAVVTPDGVRFKGTVPASVDVR